MSLGEWDPIRVPRDFEPIAGRYRCPVCKKLLSGWNRTRAEGQVLIGQSVLCRKCGLKWERDLAGEHEWTNPDGLGPWRLTQGGPTRLELLTED